MTPGHSTRAREIFEAAVQRPAAEIDGFVRTASAGNEALYWEVRHMLAEQTQPSDRALLMSRKADSAPVFSAGQLVAGRYRIVCYLSRGGMGEVYQAEDLEFHEMVALKTLLPAIASDQSMISRFKQEIQLSRKIAHTNVCRVFDLARHTTDSSTGETIVFLTMEFLPGETLAARLQHEGRLRTEAALPLLEQMADALDAAHRAGVIHRDFKPSNVMLVPAADGLRAVVTDFGLARKFVPADEPTDTLTGKVMGTLDYMAPELLTGSIASFGSDVYALGMVAYRMITGGLPFDSEPLSGAILRSRQSVPSPREAVPDLDPNWERAIIRALDPDPARRFFHAAQFIQALHGEIPDTVALPVSAGRKHLVAIGVALLLGLSLWLGWVSYARYRNRPPPESLALYHQGLDDIHAGAYYAASSALEKALQIAPRYPMARARLAEAMIELEIPDKASQQMLIVRRQDLSSLSRLDRLQVQAIDLRITREFAATAATYEQMLPLAGSDSSDLYVDLGRAYENLAQASKATAAYQHATQGASQNPAAWLRLAVRYSRDSNFLKSEEAFHRAEELYRLSSNLEGLTEVAFQRGVAANRQNNMEQGAVYLRQAMESAHLIGNIQQEVRARLQLANNAYTSGDAALAESLAREALAAAQANQLETQAIVGLVNLGNAFRRKLDLSGAERYYNDALALARRNNVPRFVALGQLSLAALHDQMKRPEDVASEASEALEYFQSNHWSQETFQGLTLLGRAQLARADYSSASDSFQRLLDAAEKAQNRAQIALAQQSLGSVFEALQQYPQALDHFRKYLELSTDAENAGYAASESGNALWRLGRYEEAATMFDKAAASAAKFPALRISIAFNRARMELSRENFAKSAALAQDALTTDTGHNPGTLTSFKTILGLATFGSGKKAEGLRICSDAVVEAAKAGDAGVLLDARLGLGQAHVENGDRALALAILKDAERNVGSRLESRWRLLALMSRVDSQYAVPARQALDAMATQLGAEAFRQYLTRPDVQKLARPLQP